MRGRAMVLVAKAALLVTLLPAMPGLQAQSAEIPSQPASPAAYSSTIQVHGDWTIVVRKADGSIALTRHFKNSIAGGGPSFISHLMARATPQFYWGVGLAGLCNTAGCFIAEPASAGDTIVSHFYNGAVTSNLTISAPTSGPNAYRFVLSGSLTSANTGQITSVSTVAVAPNGTTDDMSGVTGTNLQQPIAVQAGQTVDVTVVISFS